MISTPPIATATRRSSTPSPFRDHASIDGVELVNGDLLIAGVEGGIEADTVNGTIVVRGAAGEIELETVNGRIELELGSAMTEDVSLDSVNGTIEVFLTGSAEIRAETVNGRIRNDFGIEVKKGKYVGSSMNGSIGGGGPTIEIETVNGGIRVQLEADNLRTVQGVPLVVMCRGIAMTMKIGTLLAASLVLAAFVGAADGAAMSDSRDLGRGLHLRDRGDQGPGRPTPASFVGTTKRRSGTISSTRPRKSCRSRNMPRNRKRTKTRPGGSGWRRPSAAISIITSSRGWSRSDFGDLQQVRVTGGNDAVLTLRDGTEIEVGGYANDVSATVTVFDAKPGRVEVPWKKIETVTFSATPADADPGSFRLHGTVSTSEGDFVGYHPVGQRGVPEHGQARRRHQRRGSGSASRWARSDPSSDVIGGARWWSSRTGPRWSFRAPTTSMTIFVGSTSRMPVSAGSRWIGTSSSGSSSTIPAQAGLPTPSMQLPHTSSGTVTSHNGDWRTGELVFDLDEEWSWEMLDGRLGRDRLHGAVRHGGIHRAGGRSGCTVRLRNGIELELEDSHDVDDDNSGVVVIPTGAGEPGHVPWREIAEIEFEWSTIGERRGRIDELRNVSP